LTLNLILIPRFGGVGAAAASALTMVGLNAGLAFHVWRQLGVAPPVLLPIVRLARTSLLRRH
jgi:O-antigen/teichoic acid export membrane protein